MADNNTFVLFEEIKNKLETIYRELKELKEKKNASTSLLAPSTNTQSNEQQEQELLNQYEQQTKDILNKYIGVQVRIKDEEAKSIDKLVANVLTMLHEWQEQKEHPQPQEHIHKHSFDIKSSKVFTYVVAASILCFASLVGNFFLWQSKRQYKDDALKFRIIRVWRGCSPKEILWLNDVFDIHRNENAIRKIKKATNSYEMELKQKADSLMQMKLK
jgi:gas vesicle protein